MGLIPGLGRSPGKGNGNPFQYSCLGKTHGQRSLVGYNHGVSKSQTGFSNLTATTHSSALISPNPALITSTQMCWKHLHFLVWCCYLFPAWTISYTNGQHPFSDTLSIVSCVPSFKETCTISGVIIYHKNMSMPMLVLMHTCMHVYVREKRRGEQRKRENSVYILIVHHALQLMSKDVERCWQVKEKFLTHHEICIMQDNY